jgi:cytochrome P450
MSNEAPPIPATATVRQPVIEDDLTDSRLYAQGPPHEVFDRLRAHGPVAWVREPLRLRRNLRGRTGEVGGGGFWAVTGAAEVVEASRDPGRFSSGLRGCDLPDPLDDDDLAEIKLVMINMDAPEHTRIRRIVQGAFTPVNVERLRATAARESEAIIDDLAGAGPIDFVPNAAAELPIRILAELLGVPQEDQHLIFEWSNTIIEGADPSNTSDPEAAGRTMIDMFLYGHNVAEDRRQNPRDDLVSLIANAQIDGERLTDVEFDMFWILLLVAGNETARSLIAGGTQALLHNEEERRRLWVDPTLLGTGVAEMLRWVSPVNCFRRTATVDTELGGQRIEAGEKVVVLYGAANRDPRAFPDPHRFDLSRSPNDHVAFGFGPHFCLGAALARLEAQEFFAALIRRASDVVEAGPAEYVPSSLVSGVRRLPVEIRR